MLIYLPSNGHCKISKIDLRQPKLDDMRHVGDLSSNEELKKTQFVKMLVPNPDDVDFITTNDRDFLFTIAVSALTLNKLSFDVRCPNKECGKGISSFIMLGDCEIITLKTPLECDKMIDDRLYHFKKLLVKDEIAAVDYAMLDDDNYDERFEDAKVCAALGYEVNDEGIQDVRNMDMTIYYAAQFFQICCPHGLDITKVIECPDCHQRTKVNLDITSDMLNVNMAVVMERFASIADTLDFQSFINMTLPEYNTFIDSLNAKHEQAANASKGFPF